MQTVHIRLERFRQHHAKPQRARVRVRNIHATQGRRRARRRQQERAVHERAGRMHRNARNVHSPGKGFQLVGRGDGRERKVCAAELGGAPLTHHETCSIGCCANVARGRVSLRRGEMVGRGVPDGHWSARRRAERQVHLIAAARSAQERRSRQGRNLRLRRDLDGLGSNVELPEARRACAYLPFARQSDKHFSCTRGRHAGWTGTQKSWDATNEHCRPSGGRVGTQKIDTLRAEVRNDEL